MKKWTVLVVIALLGLILGLQYLNKKNEAKQAEQGATTRPDESAGVGLPPEATGYAQNYLVLPDPDAFTASGAFAEEMSRGACDGGSLNDIMASHGKIWGYSADARRFPVSEQPETEKVYTALGNYFSCRAVAMRDPAVCNYLPGSAPKGKGPSPRWMCSAGVTDLLSAAYMAGKYNKKPACMSILSENGSDYPGSGIKDLDPVEFCPIAAKGMENICASLPSLKKRECLKAFPAQESDCSGDKDCLEDYNLYMAVKTGDWGKCPAGNRAFCEVFFSKSQAPCSSLAAAASKLYCLYLPKLKKAPAFMLKEKKEAELLKELQKKDQEKITREINKRARKILGRE